MKVVYKNEAHEKQVLQEFEWCRAAIEKLIELYNGLQIVKCDDTGHMYDLIHDTTGRVRLDIMLKGRNTGNVIEFDRLNLHPLIAQASKCKRFSEFVKKEKGIWALKDGEVVVNDAEVKKLVEVQRIVARSPRQEEFYENLKTFERLFNEIDADLGANYSGSERSAPHGARFST
jgi:hypothetical protein